MAAIIKVLLIWKSILKKIKIKILNKSSNNLQSTSQKCRNINLTNKMVDHFMEQIAVILAKIFSHYNKSNSEFNQKKKIMRRSGTIIIKILVLDKEIWTTMKVEAHHVVQEIWVNSLMVVQLKCNKFNRAAVTYIKLNRNLKLIFCCRPWVTIIKIN